MLVPAFDHYIKIQIIKTKQLNKKNSIKFWCWCQLHVLAKYTMSLLKFDTFSMSHKVLTAQETIKPN